MIETIEKSSRVETPLTNGSAAGTDSLPRVSASSGRGAGTRSLKEMIGRMGQGGRSLSPVSSVTVDWTRTDWAFWDRLRRGKEQDYDLGGLFASPIAKIMSYWGFGDGFVVDFDHEATSDYIANWTEHRLPDILRAFYDCFSLGDSYLMVNPDGTLVRFSPDQVQIICDPPSSQNVIGYKVTTRLDGVTQIDYFYADVRITEIHAARATIQPDAGTPSDKTRMTPLEVVSRSTLGGGGYAPTWASAGGQAQVFIFQNLSGKIPVIHFPNEPGANELYGHPYIEALLRDFYRYNLTINKALDGVEVMGNPLPVIEGVDDPDETLARLSTGESQYTDQNGEIQTRFEIDFAQLPLIVVGSGGQFKLAAPQQFTADAGRMLELLFLLMLQYCGIPEWVWGGAIASSKASVDAQFPAFEKLIGGVRQSFKDPLFKLIECVLAWKTIYDPTIKQLDETAAIGFQPISPENRDALVKELTLARTEKAITKTTLVRAMKIVRDPAQEVEDAKAEALEDAPEDAAMMSYLGQAQDPATDPNTDPPPDNSGGQ